ncbi:M20 metallopeptidase family protein [Halalkalibacter krulwichiae]|uniref:M20 metallopeptidase family protein n=1 Tax=Halalkalibacter krulwichiae TaxID=199441 RepID=UPI00352FEF91
MDPILIGSQIVTGIQQIAASRINATDPSVITVCSFDGVSSYNIIPDKVTLSGTVRTFSNEARELAEKNIRQIAEGACSSAGATSEVNYEYGYPSVCNDPEEALRIKRIGEEIVGKENVSESPLQMAMEDFAYYVRKRPGAFFNVGGKNPDIQAVFPHHHPKFDVDEQSILIAGKMFISLVFDYLNGSQQDSKEFSLHMSK